MPISHHCISCGTDLSWIRAAPDPCYGLPVVVCPSCATACTRRRAPIKTAIRGFRRGLRTGLVLSIELFVLALLVGMSFGILMGFADDTKTPGDAVGVFLYVLTKQPNAGLEAVSFVRAIDMIRTIYLVLILVSVGAGVWMRSAHGHLRLWTAVGCWFSMLLGSLAVAYTVGIIDLVQHGRGIAHLTLRGELGALGVYLLSTVPFFAAGLPLGARARKIWIKQHAVNLHKKRRKLRKHRMNHARPAAH